MERAEGMSLERETVLIVLMGSLGDIARALPLPVRLKQFYPDIRISWLVDERWAELVQLSSAVDQVIVFKRSKLVAGAWQLLRELHRQHFDLSLDLQRHLKSGVCSLVAGASRRIGVHRLNSKEGNWCFNNEHLGFVSEQLSKFEHYQQYLDYIGVPRTDELDFGLRLPVAKVWQSRWNLPKRYLVVVVGSSWPSKDWFPWHYRTLLSILSQELTLGIVLVGDCSQVRLAAWLEKEVGVGSLIVNTVGKTSLTELLLLLRDAEVVVGPDSGPGHLAAAVKSPVVTLFGPTLPARVAPVGSEHLALKVDLFCSPCGKRHCPGRGRICMDLLKPGRVAEQIRLVLAGRLVGKSVDR